jgi:hypothetical protein
LGREDRARTPTVLQLARVPQFENTFDDLRPAAHAGLGDSPRLVLEELGQVQSVDVVLPIVDGPEVKVRCVIKPNDAQAALLDRLGIDLPKRLTIPKGIEEVAV